MKKLILLLIASIFLISIVSAQLTFELNEKIDLKVGCFDTDDDICSSTSICNITVFYPNLTTMINEQTMTNQRVFFNYTIDKQDKIGEYNSLVGCSDSATNGYTSFAFYVGRNYTEAQSGIISTVILLSFGISLFFLFFASKTESLGISLLFIGVSFITMISSLGLSVVAIQQMLQTDAMLETTSRIFYALLIIFGIFITFIFIRMTIKALDALKSNRGLK